MGWFSSTDLQFDTTVLQNGSTQYRSIADTLESDSEKLQTLLSDLASTDWTTGAGLAFQEMVEDGYLDSVTKYIALLRTMSDMLDDAAKRYDNLTQSHIETTKLRT